MRALWIALVLLAFLPLVGGVFGADEPVQDHVKAECMVVRMSDDLARKFSTGHDLNADAAGCWAALQMLLQAKKAEFVADLKVTAKTHERATREQGMVKLVVDSVPSSIPGGIMTDIQVSCDNHTTTTHSTWKAHAERFFGPYESTWKGEPVIYLAFLYLQSGGADPGSKQ